jgi:hypothetical protein
MVSAYQGVRTVTMASAGYTVPTQGGPNPGGFVGIPALDSVGVNSSWSTSEGAPPIQGITYPYSDHAFLGNGHSNVFSDVNLANFYAYKLTPTGLIQIHLNGTPILNADSSFGVGVPAGVLNGNFVSAVFQGASLSLIYGLNNVSSSGVIASPVMSSSATLTGPTPNSGPSRRGFIRSTSGLKGYALISRDLTGNSMVFVFSDFNTLPPIKSVAYTGINGQFASASFNFDSVSGSNYLFFLSVSSGNTYFQPVSFDASLNPTFGSQNIITFSNDPTTGINTALVMPVINGWILSGNTLADSSFYFMSTDGSQYWNLKFTGGPSLNSSTSVMPVIDSAGNYYTVDPTTGAVFFGGGVIPPFIFYPPLAVSQTPPFPLSNCFRVPRHKGQC